MTTKNRMSGNMMLTSRLLKIMSIVIVACMLVTLTACGSTVSQQDLRPTAEYNTEEHEDINDPDDPEQTIDDGYWHEDPTEEPSSTEEPTTSEPASQQNGAYTYTIYNNIQISMDVNVDDYVTTNSSGMTVFKYGKLMEDYGWTCTDEAEHIYAYYYEDMAIVMYLHNYPDYADRINFNGNTDRDYFQVQFIQYFLVAQDDFSVPYSNSSDPIGLGAQIVLSRHADDCKYLIAPSISSVCSRDDIILLAYLVSSVARDPGRNPFYDNSDFANYENGSSTGAIDYQLP